MDSPLLSPSFSSTFFLRSAMRSVSEAESLIFQHLPVFSCASVRLAEAGERVLREAICADRPLPPYHRSMMDGIALRAARGSLSGSKGLALQVERTQYAGMPAGSLADVEGGCVRIMTGAVVPAGADCVLPVEWLAFEEVAGAERVSITVPVNAPDIVPGLFVHAEGSDRAAGEVLVPAGTRLDPPKIAIAAAVGLAEVVVSVRPRVALISTGDELIEPGRPIAPHQIRPSSTFGLASALRALGCEPVRLHVPDDPEALAKGVDAALNSCDAIVSSGGVSKGGKDFLPGVLAELGVTEYLHRVSQKPGRPMWFGVRGAGEACTPVFALPGNPVSTLVCFRRFVQPAFERALGLALQPTAFAALAEDVVFRPALTHFCAVSVEPSSDGRLRATPVRINTSGDFSALGASDGFLQLPPAPAEFPAGEVFPFFAW